MDIRNTKIVFSSANSTKSPDGGVYVNTINHAAAADLEQKNVTVKTQGQNEVAFDNSVQAMSSDPSLGMVLILTQLADSLASWLEVNVGRNEAIDTLRTMFGLGGARKAAIAREEQMPSTQPSLG